MTITTGSSSSAAPAFNPRQTAPAAAAAQASTPLSSTDYHGGNWTFLDPADTGPITASMGSAQAIALRDKLAEKFKAANTAGRAVDLFILDKDTSGLYFTVIVLAMRNVPTGKGVAFYTLVLESTNDAPEDDTQDINGVMIPIKRPASDAYDKNLVQAVIDQLAAAYEGQALFDAGATVVPRHFNAEDQAAVHSLALLCSRTTNTALRVQDDDFQDVNLRDARGDTTLETSIRFQRETLLDEVQNPVRSDMTITFASHAPRDSKDKSLNSGRRDAVFGKVNAFIEPVWAPMQPQSGNPWSGYNPNQNVLQFNQKYAGRMVITQMTTERIATLSANHLMLLASLAAGHEQTWFGAFYNTGEFGVNDVDITDVGALNHEGNVFNSPDGGYRLDTRAAGFTAELFGDYMMRLFRPGLFYSMDIALCGPSTSSLEAYRDASENNDPEARKAIIDGFELLTDGEFGKLYTGALAAAPMFVEQSNLIHLGYYLVGGVKRDIRDFDLTAMANHYGDKGPEGIQMLRLWTDTFYQTSVPLARRLADRWKLITAVAPSAVCTGYALRVTPSLSLLDTAAKAAVNAGLATRLKAPSTALGTPVDRGVAGFVGQAMMPAGAQPMFHTHGNNGGAVQAGAGGAAFYSRYAR